MLAIMEFCKPTDQVHFIEVTPRLLQVYWLQAQVAPGSRIGLHIDSLWLTRNDKLHIKIVDARGSTQFSKTINMLQASARIEFILKQNAQQSLQATVRINRQGQILQSDVLPISANRPLLFAMRWQHTRVARGQLLHLQAECRGISDGTPVHFDLFRHSPNHVGDTPITGFTASVQHNRIDREWQFDIPLSTANLPFPYERHVQTAFGLHYYYLVAHIHQQRFVQARDHYLQFDRDHIEVNVNAAFFPQCQAKLFSSDGKQQSVLLRAGHTSQLSISPGPCLLLIQIDLRQQLASLPTRQGKKFRAPTHVNPILAKLIRAKAMQWQATTSYIPAPIPSVRWSHASAYAAKPLLTDLMSTTEEKAAGIRQSGNLLAIDTPNKDAWLLLFPGHARILPRSRRIQISRTPARLRIHIIGQECENADCTRFSPTKAVNRKNAGCTK